MLTDVVSAASASQRTETTTDKMHSQTSEIMFERKKKRNHTCHDNLNNDPRSESTSTEEVYHKAARSKLSDRADMQTVS